ncbi:MAG: methyltransferase domain-containing protein [Nitrospirales bacterium]|nr:methyltransferase domain-containing protein [Nitrospirales bacterium]
MALNEAKLNEFMGKIIGDMGAAIGAALVLTGDRLGLYKALSQFGPLTSHQLAERTGTTERYIREWLASQAASGYIEYHSETNQFSMTPEQVAVFADEHSPVYACGGFYSIASVIADEPKITDAFRTGHSIPWGDRHPCLFCGTAKFFRSGYQAYLISSWIPALQGVEEKLQRGARVADVGCGHGHSMLIMAKSFPNTEFVGFDIHPPSIEEAESMAKDTGLTNVRFEVATAKTYPGDHYDLVTFFDCLHDMGDPVGAAEHVKASLAHDGTWLIVEPFAKDSLAENLNPVGRVYYGFSTTVCTPVSLSQEVGVALGAQAGEARLRDVVMSGGFTRFRRATETPFNLILEARP